MQTTYANQADVPADQTDNFVEFKQGDNTVFMLKELAEANKATFRAQGDLTQYKAAEQVKLDAATAQAATDAKAATEQALASQLAELQAKGDTAGAATLLAEQNQTALDDTKAQLETANATIASAKDAETAKSIADQVKAISNELLKPDMIPAIGKLINARFKIVEGASTFTNDKGDAVSATVEQAIEMLRNEAAFKPFLLPPTSKGGHGGQGGRPNSPAPTLSGRAAVRAARRMANGFK